MMPGTVLAIAVALSAVGIFMLKWYMNGGTCNSAARLDGQVVIVTGANTGLGKYTAADLANRGGRVILACRSLEKGERAATEIRRETGADDNEVSVMQLDLASLASVRKFAEDFKKKEKHLHILINNAGVASTPYTKTEDGFELQFGTNHLGHFLLTHLLLDILKASAPSRVVTVSSVFHKDGKINFDDLMSEKYYHPRLAYRHSKLANVLFSRELAKQLEGTGVTTYSLHPGFIYTEIWRHKTFEQIPVLKQLLPILTWPFFKTIPQGAQTQICCAVDESLASETGKYYSDCEEQTPAPAALDDATAARLWAVSEELVGIKKP